MANLSKEDGTLAIHNAADLLGRTDEQLLAALPYTNVQGVATRESITSVRWGSDLHSVASNLD